MSESTKSTPKKTEKRKEAMLESLEKSMGVVTTAAKNAGIERTTHYMWMEQDEKYAEKVKEIENVALDFAESKLFKKIQDGDNTSIIFYLKTKGKQRGYVEKQQHDVHDSREIPKEIVVEPHPDLNENPGG